MFMKYVALLRGVNVGTTRWVDMKRLKALFARLGYTAVSSYLNSGNVLFEAAGKAPALRAAIEAAIKAEFGFDVQVLVKSEREMKAIAAAIPSAWVNDDKQRTDVAYLFPEIDSARTLAELPLNKEYVDARYTKGALYWNLQRKNLYKSRLNKLISHAHYRLMTLRNINTARKLGGREER